MPTPNIMYIHSHDTGRYVQPYGHAIPTPNIQQLAEDGVLFRRAFCANPTCSPSRAALVTGQSAHSCGMLGLAHRGFGLYDYGHHIVHTLRSAGYHTALSGTQHVALHGDKSLIGYDEILDDDGQNPIDAVNDYLGRRDTARPFFLTIGFGETHRVFDEPGPDEDERYTLPPPTFPDTPETRRDMASFKASARKLDGYMGRVFDLLAEHGVADDTLVICTTDHGIAFPSMKCNLYDGGIGIMLIMRWANGADYGFTPGSVSDALTSQIDLFPTLCDIVGIEPPTWLEGTSLLPALRIEVEDVNEEIFAEVNFHASYEPMRCARTNRWKYIKRWSDRSNPILPNCDNSVSKTLWQENGWKQRELASEELYDLVFDPNERDNLAQNPTYADTLSDMRSRLDRWMERTDDPLLAGKVEAPSGAKLNDPAGDSPNEAVITVP
jgi:N-sulfoglucosamine sulfohydrolase